MNGMSLPNDIFYSILNQISCPKTYVRLSLVCKRICDLSKNKDLTKKFLEEVEYDSNDYYFYEKYTINLLNNGKKEGLYEKSWCNSGQLKNKCNYVNGLKEGISEIWYTNGQLSSRTSYICGKKEGLHERWYMNGQLASRNSYICGKEEVKVHTVN